MIRPSVTLEPTGSTTAYIGLIRASGGELAEAFEGYPAEETDPLVALRAIADYAKSTASEDYSGGRVNDFATGELIGAWTQLRSDLETLRLYLFPIGDHEWLFIGAFAAAGRRSRPSARTNCVTSWLRWPCAWKRAAWPSAWTSTCRRAGW